MGGKGYISDEDIERLKYSVDIVSIIESYIPLKRAGTNFKACCPFHEEDTASFVVFPDDQRYHCFGAGCGEGGDVIRFVQEIEKLTFKETVELLADRIGMRLSYSPGQQKRINRDNLLKKINADAAEFYHRKLFEEEGHEAYTYLTDQRGFSEADIRSWRLGFCPGKRDRGLEVLYYLLDRGYTEGQLLDAGIIRKGDEDENDYYNPFWERIIFPINNRRGDSIAFGGRVLDDRVPKYLNSPQSGLFNKSNVLYGLDKAAGDIAEKKEVIVFEGYTDPIAARRREVYNSVATLGVALTESHIEVLKRMGAEKIYVCMDPDEPGIKAAIKAGKRVAEQDLELRIIRLSEEKEEDPAEYFRSHDAEEFQDVVDVSKSLIQFGIEVYGLQDVPESEYWKRIRRTRKIYPIIDSLMGAFPKTEGLRAVAEALDIDARNLTDDYVNYMMKNIRKRSGKERPVEELYLGFITVNPSSRRSQPDIIDKEDFSKSVFGEYYSFLCRRNEIDDAILKPHLKVEEGTLFEHEQVQDIMKEFMADCGRRNVPIMPEELAGLEGTVMQSLNSNPRIIDSMKMETVTRRLRGLDKEIDNISKNKTGDLDDLELLKELLAERHKLYEEYKKQEGESV